jgi:hypothetical protein
MYFLNCRELRCLALQICRAVKLPVLQQSKLLRLKTSFVT